jgi:hypothetical protein
MAKVHLRRVLLLFGLIVLVAPAAWAGPGVVGPNVKVSGASPFASCTADDVAGQTGTNFPNSEVEPWIAVSGVDRSGDGTADVIGAYQQDRWSNGGSRGRAGGSVAWGRPAGPWRQDVRPGAPRCGGGA